MLQRSVIVKNNFSADFLSNTIKLQLRLKRKCHNQLNHQINCIVTLSVSFKPHIESLFSQECKQQSNYIQSDRG